ncbi:MAG: hypothetical protein JXP73_21350 [Deltaproteobacteria bacterium]|nr:hypothetical protein [Deltaproteobacteria bacterium]
MSRRLVPALVLVGLLAAGGAAVAAGKSEAPAGGGAAAAESKDAEAAAAPAEGSGVAAEADTAAAPAASETSEGGGLFEQSTAAASSEAAASGQPALALGGYVRGDAYVGKVMDDRQADLKAGYGELALVARTSKTPYGDGFAETRLRYGLQGDLHQTFLDVREAYVNAYLGPVDLRVGKQIVVWGRADILNPTNNLTPNDLRIRSPIEDDRRIGNVGARAFVRLSPLRFEAVWLPSYVASELPPVSLPRYVYFGAPKYPSPGLKTWTEAARVHLEMPSFEMSVSYLYGYAPLPGLTLRDIVFDKYDPQVLIARTAYKHQVVGFDFSTALGDILGIRGEAAYRRPFKYDDLDYRNLVNTPSPDLQYALGFDHNFGSVMVIVQYLGRYAFDWEKKEDPAMELDPDSLRVDRYALDEATYDGQKEQYGNIVNTMLARFSQMLFNQTERIQHLATARVEWTTLHDTLSLSAIGMVNFSTREWLAAPKIGYRISDSMTAYVGAEVLTGPSGTLFGLVDETLSAGYAELRSTF